MRETGYGLGNGEHQEASKKKRKGRKTSVYL